MDDLDPHPQFCGDGFLYNMVRAIAGTLTYVGAAATGARAIERRTARLRPSRPDRPCLPAVCL